MQASDLSWPIHAIDLEASSLAKLSYPVEVAVARWNAPDDPRGVTFHTLVGETEEWRRRGVWNDASQRIHRIDRRLLADAPHPERVMDALNAFTRVGTLALCDGGGHDAYWLERLAHAGGARPAFVLGSWGDVLHFLDPDQRARLSVHHSDAEVAHRAAPDAEMRLDMLAFALGIEPPRFSRIGP